MGPINPQSRRELMPAPGFGPQQQAGGMGGIQPGQSDMSNPQQQMAQGVGTQVQPSMPPRPLPGNGGPMGQLSPSQINPSAPMQPRMPAPGVPPPNPVAQPQTPQPAQGAPLAARPGFTGIGGPPVSRPRPQSPMMPAPGGQKPMQMNRRPQGL